VFKSKKKYHKKKKKSKTSLKLLIQIIAPRYVGVDDEGRPPVDDYGPVRTAHKPSFGLHRALTGDNDSRARADEIVRRNQNRQAVQKKELIAHQIVDVNLVRQS
jgi:hypothetical protein